MKTKLFIAVLMITSITFAQKKNHVKSNNQNTKEVNAYMKIDDVKGESNDKSSKKAIGFIKLMDVKGETNKKQNTSVVNKNYKNKPSEKIKMNEQLLNKPPKKKKSKAHYTTRKRVVVLK
jgi:hypothetical protein